jgi:hypothetical protein
MDSLFFDPSCGKGTSEAAISALRRRARKHMLRNFQNLCKLARATKVPGIGTQIFKHYVESNVKVRVRLIFVYVLIRLVSYTYICRTKNKLARGTH